MRLSIAKRTITILKPGQVVEWGETVADWAGGITRYEIPGCTDYALSGVEQIMGVDVSAGCRQIFLPLIMDGHIPKVRTTTGDLIKIEGTDRVERFGDEWEIIGEPGPQISPTGRVSNLEILIKRWDGKK